jgi:putative acyl-CoA dehydrogenase
MCLDVLRALSREPDAALAVCGLADASHGLPAADEAVAFIGTTFHRAEDERMARLAAEKLALLATTSAINKVSPQHAELLFALAGNHATMYGAVRPQRRRHACPAEQAVPLSDPDTACQLKVV